MMDNSASPAPVSSSKANFISLPTALRLQIYDIIMEARLNERINVNSSLRRMFSRLPRTPFHHSATSLAMSYKFIANEICGYFGSLPASRRLATMSIDAYPDAVGRFYVHRAPCRVGDLTALEVIVNLKVGKRGL